MAERSTPVHRIRPRVAATVAPDVSKALQERAAREGRPLSHVVEDVLRAGLGLPPEASPVNATP
jgi:plasmid stability protein